MTVLLVFLTPLLCGTSFFLGLLYERLCWNRLIIDGKLPKPRT